MTTKTQNNAENKGEGLTRLEAIKKDTYHPNLVYGEGFEISSVFDCRDQMIQYSGDTDFHSLMHKVQKPLLTSNKVQELSFFANKLLLRKWVYGLVPLQKVFGFSAKLNYESEIHHLFQIVEAKVRNFEEFIIKPSNGSESIGTLKVFRHENEMKTRFLNKKIGNCENIDGDKVISDYEVFKSWIFECILGVTSGNIDTHLRHIKPGLIIQELFPHDKKQRGPMEMKFFTAWGELLFVGCRNSKGVHLGKNGEHLEGDIEIARILVEKFFHDLKKAALSLAEASTFPNLRYDFFVDIESGKWVLNEIETLADCRSLSDYLLENIGKFYLQGWVDKIYQRLDSPLTISVLRERLSDAMKA